MLHAWSGRHVWVWKGAERLELEWNVVAVVVSGVTHSLLDAKGKSVGRVRGCMIPPPICFVWRFLPSELLIRLLACDRGLVCMMMNVWR